MFPYANGNLRSYWTSRPKPEFSRRTELWVLEQMQGIASALRIIHKFKREIPRPQSQASKTVDRGEELYGRHGDIKPENLLWRMDKTDSANQMGVLIITDFGLGRFHGRDSRSRVDPLSVGCTASYAPPELALMNPVSRAYDIWSLGCVYLEFITWLLYGAHALDDFSEARMTIGHNGIESDAFYEVINQPGRLGPGEARVKPVVNRWIDKLRVHQQCSYSMCDLLSLIQVHLLVVDALKRASSPEVDSALTKILDRAKSHRKYSLNNPGRPPEEEMYSTHGMLVATHDQLRVKLKRQRAFSVDISANTASSYGVESIESDSLFPKTQKFCHINLSIPVEKSPAIVRRDIGEDKSSEELFQSNETSRKHPAQDDVSGESLGLELVKRQKLLHLSADLVGSSSMQSRHND